MKYSYKIKNEIKRIKNKYDTDTLKKMNYDETDKLLSDLDLSLKNAVNTINGGN